MNQQCREKLLKSIQAAHRAVVAYANCLCEDIPEADQEIFFKFGLELSVQLQELRKLYSSLYQVDPLNEFSPIQTCCCSSKSRNNLDS